MKGKHSKNSNIRKSNINNKKTIKKNEKIATLSSIEKKHKSRQTYQPNENSGKKRSRSNKKAKMMLRLILVIFIIIFIYSSYQLINRISISKKLTSSKEGIFKEVADVELASKIQ